MSSLLKKRFIIPLLLMGAFFSGPRPDFPALEPTIMATELSLSELENHIGKKNIAVPKLRPGNEARLIWADSTRPTPYSVVYLHGFSASPVEGAPVHEAFAKRYGCNLYLPLLAGHGMDDIESFKDISPKDLVDSAKEAIAIGQLIGEKVIVMSCSTGSTLSAYLAAQNPKAIWAQIMYSPNIDLGSRAAEMLTMPWGLQIARLVVGGNYNTIRAPEIAHPYWTKTYRIEGAIAVKALINATMTNENFSKITQPLFVGYYYKNEEESDHVISIPAVNEFFDQVATPPGSKQLVAFPDVQTHVIVSDLQSQDWEAVRDSTFQFAEQILRLRRID